MANITITIPDAKLPHVLEALSAQWQYDALVAQHAEAGTTPPSAQVFVRDHLTQYLKDAVRSYDADVAVTQARAGVTDPF